MAAPLAPAVKARAHPPTKPPGTSQFRRGQRRAAAFLITPFFVLFAAVMAAPIGYAVWMSLFQEHSSGLGFGGTERVFSGLGNYAKALSDAGFRDSFVHIALYCALYIPVMIGGSLLLALLVDSAMARAKRFFQLALFLPHAIPGLIASIIWIYLYTPGLSPCSTGSAPWAAHGTSTATITCSRPWSTSAPGSGSATW